VHFHISVVGLGLSQCYRRQQCAGASLLTAVVAIADQLGFLAAERLGPDPDDVPIREYLTSYPDEDVIMTGKIAIDAKTTALLVMDFQTLIVDGYAADKEALLDRTARLLDAARAARMTVIYIVVGFRAGHPEVSSRNLSFSAVKSAGIFATGSAGSEIHPAVAAEPDDVVVTKHRVSAFTGTDLDMILRANGIETLLLAGIATSGVVLSTVRHAADADYRLVVVGDCCSDKDADVHRILVERVFTRQATVVTSQEIMAGL